MKQHHRVRKRHINSGAIKRQLYPGGDAVGDFKHAGPSRLYPETDGEVYGRRCKFSDINRRSGLGLNTFRFPEHAFDGFPRFFERVRIADADGELESALIISSAHQNCVCIDVAIRQDGSFAIESPQARRTHRDFFDYALVIFSSDLIADHKGPAPQDENARKKVLQDVLESEPDRH